MLEHLFGQKERKEDTWKYVFPAEQSELPYAFYRLADHGSAEKSVHATIHFDGNVFRSPDDKSEISISDFVDQLRKKLCVEKITLSCCYPDKAKQVAGDMHDVEIIGSGNCEVRTKFNDRQRVITVESISE